MQKASLPVRVLVVDNEEGETAILVVGQLVHLLLS